MNVLTLYGNSTQDISDHLLDVLGSGLPVHGARLVWPSCAPLDRHPVFTASDIRGGWPSEESRGRNDVVGQVMRIVAPTSVTAAGANAALAAARRAVAGEKRRANDKRLRERYEGANAAPTSGEKVDELNKIIDELHSDKQMLIEMIDDEQSRHEAEMREWQANLQAISLYSSGDDASNIDDSSEVDWDDMPELDGDLTDLATALSAATGGAIVFTPNALDAWESCQYLGSKDKMRTYLTQLAKAAIEFRHQRGQTGSGSFSKWLHNEFGITNAFQDDPLVERRLHTFEFEGRTWERTPHLQLGQATQPNRVGRVYFAVDGDDTGPDCANKPVDVRQARFIVDHVGLKLYGV